MVISSSILFQNKCYQNLNPIARNSDLRVLLLALLHCGSLRSYLMEGDCFHVKKATWINQPKS